VEPQTWCPLCCDVARTAPAPGGTLISVVETRERGRDDSSRVDLSRSAANLGRGEHMSIPLWIVLPVLTPLTVIVAALALHHLEQLVLPPSQTVPTDTGLVGHRPAPGGSSDR
jgi:hypothetical protein